MSGVHLWIGQKTHKSSTFTSKKRGCMSYCFLVNSQKQKTLGSTAVISYFLMCNSNLQTRCRQSIILPLKNMSRQLHCSMMIYRKETTRYKAFSTKTWHCNHREMHIRATYKDVKTPSPILGRSRKGSW